MQFDYSKSPCTQPFFNQIYTQIGKTEHSFVVNDNVKYGKQYGFSKR